MEVNVENYDKCIFCCYLYKPRFGIGFCTVWRKEVNGQDKGCKYFEEDDVVTWAKVNGFI